MFDWNSQATVTVAGREDEWPRLDQASHSHSNSAKICSTMAREMVTVSCLTTRPDLATAALSSPATFSPLQVNVALSLSATVQLRVAGRERVAKLLAGWRRNSGGPAWPGMVLGWEAGRGADSPADCSASPANSASQPGRDIAITSPGNRYQTAGKGETAHSVDLPRQQTYLEK